MAESTPCSFMGPSSPGLGQHWNWEHVQKIGHLRRPIQWGTAGAKNNGAFGVAIFPMYSLFDGELVGATNRVPQPSSSDSNLIPHIGWISWTINNLKSLKFQVHCDHDLFNFNDYRKYLQLSRYSYFSGNYEPTNIIFVVHSINNQGFPVDFPLEP